MIVAATSPAVSRELARLGANVRSWRKIAGLTAEMAADRAGVSRDTLRAIETGRSASTENLLAVLRILGILAPVIEATDPINSEFGVQNLARASVERVRVPGRRPRTEEDS
jgi:transcriptional regulator with XRE-family HTH domain